MSASNKLIQAAAGAGGEETDADFESTVLLLNAEDASNGGQNNTFLDSSSNTHTITRNGNVTQGSFSPFSVDDGKWGNYFDGNDYLDVPDDLSFAMGTGDFTIECWIFRASGLTLFDTRDADDSAGFAVLVNGSLLQFRTNANIQISGGTVSNNVWHHVALCRNSGTTKLFFNGTQIGSDYSDSNNYSADNFTIGRVSYTGLNFFKGYISNLRVIKGTALYTSAFTPSTTPLTAVSGTSLLTCQSNRFVDNSSNAHSITVNGDTKVAPFSPFPQTTAYSASTNGGSGYFDNIGDYLSAAHDSSYNLGSGAFTVEAWVWFDDISTHNEAFIIGLYGSQANRRSWLLSRLNSDIRFRYSADGSAANAINLGTTLKLNTWYHIAVTRDSSSDVRIFLNGVPNTATNVTTTFYNNTVDPILIGDTGAGSVYAFNGYIADARVIKGTALYTSAFTPPTAPLTDITNTSLLCNFTNASIIDATGKNVIETVGNAQVDTTTVKYGTGAMEFDGNGDYLEIPGSEQLAFATGDWTIETWVYRAIGSPQYQFLFDMRDTGSQAAPCLYFDNDNITYYVNGAGASGLDVVATGTSRGEWVHLAVVKNSGTTTVYINGSSIGTYSDSNNYVAPNLYIASRYTDTQYIQGFIDDFRITKGIARYTANFTPPTAELPVIGEE